MPSDRFDEFTRRQLRPNERLFQENAMPSSEVMGKFKRGQLHSGSKHGPKVKNRKQAIAVMMSEKRNEAKHGGKYKESGKKSREKRLEGKSL